MNNILSKIRFAFLLLITLGLLSCKTTTINHYFTVTNLHYTIPASGEGEYTIAIESEYEWKSSASDFEWIVEGKKTENSLEFTVHPNNTTETREGIISITSADFTQEVIIIQYGNKLIYKSLPLELGGGSFSPDGNYIAFASETVNGIIPSVYDIRTEEHVYYKEYAVDGQGLPITVSNSGDIFFNGQMIKVDGSIVDVKLPEDTKDPRVTCFANDGSFVGYVTDASAAFGAPALPVKWNADGSSTILPLPTDPYHENGKVPTTAYVRGCSDDGSVIYGSDTHNSRYAIVWTKGGAEVAYIGQEYVSSTSEQFRIDAGGFEISPNGKYIATSLSSGRDRTPAIYNVDTKEVKLCTSFNATSTTASDNGELFFTTPTTGPNEGFVMNADNTTENLAEWFYANLGLKIQGNDIVMHITANGNILGYKEVGGKYSTWYVTIK